MFRHEFCRLIDMDEGSFKSRMRRDQLAFEAEDDSPRMTYTVDNALLMRLDLALSEDMGISPTLSSNAVSNAIGYLRGRIPTLLAAATAPQDIYIGVERWANGAVVGRDHYAGTLHEIADLREKRNREDGENYSNPTERTRLFLANVSAAARSILKRAGDLKINIDS